MEKTIHTHRHIVLKVKTEDKVEMDLEQIPQTPHERPFKVQFSPLANLSTLCTRYQNVVAKSFELKPNVLNCLSSLYDLENEDLNNHLNDFHTV